MQIDDFREYDAVEGFYELYRSNKITAEQLGKGILLHARQAGESDEARVERQTSAASPLIEALRGASASDVVLALAAVEAEDRQGFQYEVGVELHSADPCKVYPGPGPYAHYDRDDHGYVTLTAYDPARRADAVKGIRAILTRPTTMEAIAMLKKLDTTSVEFEFYNKRDADETRAIWESYGFTAAVSGFGTTRNATTHTVRLHNWGKAAPC